MKTALYFSLIFLISINLFAFEKRNLQTTDSVADKYVLPNGAGKKDGSSWENALCASQNGLQKVIDELQSDSTIWIGSGTYSNISLNLKTGGENGSYKKIIGKDLGSGLPLFINNFDKNNPSKTGQTFLNIQKRVSNFWIQDIQLKNYQIGIKSDGGQHQNLRINNVDAENCRECISLDGGATVDDTQIGSHDIEIKDCDFLNYTKRGIRLKNGNYSVRIINSTADAGGKEWATEPFQMGFQVAGVENKTEGSNFAPDHDITFINCTSRNNYNDAGDKYWNADGFVAEKGTYNLKFIDCKAFDNTDGGWDDKSIGTNYEGCISLRNKRNYRIWGEVKMLRSIGAYSIFPGGSGDEAGLWTEGKVVAESCTFHNNGVGIKIAKTGSVTIINSIISLTKDRKGVLSEFEKSAELKNIDSILWKENEIGENPKFINDFANWNGEGKDFDSQTFGKRKGFYSKSN